MKNISLTLLIGLLFIGILVYVLANFAPYDNEKIAKLGLDYMYQDQMELTDNIDNVIDYGVLLEIFDSKVVGISLALSAVGVVMSFAGLHIAVDKLFFRTYKEKPNYMVAYRRAIELYASILTLVWLRFVGVLNWVNVLAVLFLAFFVELAFIKGFGKKNGLTRRPVEHDVNDIDRVV